MSFNLHEFTALCCAFGPKLTSKVKLVQKSHKIMKLEENSANSINFVILLLNWLSHFIVRQNEFIFVRQLWINFWHQWLLRGRLCLPDTGTGLFAAFLFVCSSPLQVTHSHAAAVTACPLYFVALCPLGSLPPMIWALVAPLIAFSLSTYIPSDCGVDRCPHACHGV